MAAPLNGNDVRRSGLLGNRAVSSSLRAKSLTLPGVHNRDTRVFLDLVSREDVSEAELLDYTRDMRPETVFALVQSAARRLGEGWVEDSVDFAELSIRTARLHSLLQHARDRLEPLTHSPAFAVLVQPFDDHILGAALLEARLRHAGFATEFFPAWQGEPLKTFDGIFVCVSNSERRDELEAQIRAIRAIVGPELPIIAGGRGSTSGRPIRNADLVTSSLIEAIEFCEAHRKDRTV